MGKNISPFLRNILSLMIKELGISVKKGGLFIYVRRPPCWKKKLKSYFLNKNNDIEYFLFMSFGHLN